MPGLVGCVSDRPPDSRLIDAMVRPMWHRPTYQVRRHTEDGVAIASVDLAPGRQQHWAQSLDRRYLLVAFGAIYEDWVRHGEALGTLLLARWEEQGSRGLSGLNGEYLVVVWDRLERQLTIVNDRLGLKRLHLWYQDGILAFASELKGVAVSPEVSRDINEQAVVELLTFGHLQGERTLLRDITLLPPAAILTWHQGRITITTYWDYAFRADPGLDDASHAADAYARCIQQAVARRIEGRQGLGLLLSGGLDSRALAGMVRRLRPEDSLWTGVTGHAHAHDVRFAKRIADVIASRHTVVDIPETYLQDAAEFYAWLLDGAHAAAGCHRTYAVPPSSAAVEVLLNGFLGDVLSGTHMLERAQGVTDINRLVEIGYQYYSIGASETLLASLLRSEVYGRIRGAAKDTLAQMIRRAHVESPADRLAALAILQQPMGDALAQVILLNADVQTLTPFTDKDVIDCSLRLPFTHRVDQRNYRAVICREFPRLARVPRSGDGLPLIRSRVRASLHWRWLLLERSLLPRLTFGRMGGHPYAHYVHCSEWFRSANRDFIKRTLLNSPLLEDMFRLEQVKKFVNEFLEGRALPGATEAIAALVSFVLFRERLQQLRTIEHLNPTSCAALSVT